MKTLKLHIIRTIILSVIITSSFSTLQAEKSIFIPSEFNSSWADDFCNKNRRNGTIYSIDDLNDDSERWSKNRSYQTENVICFWESGFGSNPEKMIDPSNPNNTFNLKEYMNVCEDILKHHIDDMQTISWNGKNWSKYKMLFMLNYTTNWMAYGSGYDNTIGAMWVNPAAIGVNSQTEYPYYTLAHEMFHAISYQCGVDKTDESLSICNDSNNGPFWERSANHAADDMYPNGIQDLARYMYATHSHYLNTRKHYTTSFLLLNMEEEFGKLVLGNIWKNNRKEHVLQTASRLFFDDNITNLNDFIANTAMKNITYDYTEGTGAYAKKYVQTIQYNTDATHYDYWTGACEPYNIIMKKYHTIPYAVDYEKRHFAIRDCQAPQDYGYNAIQIFPEKLNDDGTATFTMRFRGHTEGDNLKKAGWRWGFVAVQKDGSPRYGDIYHDDDRVVSFTQEANDAQIWLIVTGAPTEFNDAHWYTWEAGFPKYYRYPYEFRLDNAVPMGYNEDYEGTKTNGAPHSNGGGWVANTAKVASSAYVGPQAKVLGNAVVSDNARIEDFAIIKGAANISDNAIIKENAMVFSNAKVYGNAIIAGEARVFNNCEIYENAFITDNAYMVDTKMYGNAIACGNLWQRDASSFTINGTAIAGGDGEAAGANQALSSGTYLQFADNANNGRTLGDGKGNLSIADINTLKENWNNVPKRLETLSYSINKQSNNPNYDINLTNYPNYYSTDTEMSLESTHTQTIVDQTISVYVEGKDIVITNASKNVQIYTISGIKIGERRPVHQSVRFTVTTGEYIVQSDGKIWKVIVR